MTIRIFLLGLALIVSACGDNDSTSDGAGGEPSIAPESDGSIEMSTDDGLDDDDSMVSDAGVQTADQATDMAPPEVLSLNSIVPNRGSVEGGTSVRIVGGGFTEATRFDFDGQPCAELSIESPNRATCLVPPGAAIGSVDVIVSRSYNSERTTVTVQEGFTYFTPLSISMISPDRVNTVGGTPVIVYGTGFVEGTEVRVDNQRQTTVEIIDTTELTFISPPHDDGTTPVLIRNVDGSVESSITYFDTLEIDSLDPAIGLITGGEQVVINGNGLKTSRLSPATVTIGGQSAEVLNGSEDATSLTVVTPAVDTPGLVDIVVSTGVIEATAASAFLYYEASGTEFDVFGIAPNRGNVLGGDTVDIAGQGFSEDVFVLIDGAPAQDCITLTSNRIRCITPIGREGQTDVEIVQDGFPIVLPLAYTYFRAVTLISVAPEKGAICGGAQVVARGTGFTPDTVITFGGAALEDAIVQSEERITGILPPNSEGYVDVAASDGFSEDSILQGFLYFDPASAYGGVWGDAIDGSVNVTVIDASTGDRIAGAVVLAFSLGDELLANDLTNENGQVTLSNPSVRPPLNLTVAADGFEANTVEDVEVQNVTVLLASSAMGSGSPPSVVPAQLSGTITGLDALPKPVQETFVNVILVNTSHSTHFNRTRYPDPGPGAMLFEDGPFSMNVLPSELAVIATAGQLPRAQLDLYQAGQLDYWTMRRDFTPISMGMKRFISAAPGDVIADLDIVLDHPMDHTIPIDLDNPPNGIPGPQYYAVLPRMNLGPEGFWELDTVALDFRPSLNLERMPRLDGWGNEVSFYLIGYAFTNTADNTPNSISTVDTRDVDNGVFISPFVAAPVIRSPLNGGTLSESRRVVWDLQPGYDDNQIVQPSATLVLIEKPGLFGPEPLWRYIVPPGVTQVELPDLPPEAGASGLVDGPMILTILPFLIEGDNFDFDSFTLYDISQGRWDSWSTGIVNFQR
jgi:hypothetical protein